MAAVDAAMAVATASIMSAAKTAVGAVAVQAHGDGARRPARRCRPGRSSSDARVTQMTLSTHAIVITRRVDCAKESDAIELLLTSTTEPLLPVDGNRTGHVDGALCRVVEYSGECSCIRTANAECHD